MYIRFFPVPTLVDRPNCRDIVLFRGFLTYDSFCFDQRRTLVVV